MARVWEAHNDDGICDNCGARGFVWDLYGDLLCVPCANWALNENGEDGSPTLPDAPQSTRSAIVKLRRE